MPDYYDQDKYRDPFADQVRPPYTGGMAKGIVGGIVAGIERRKRRAMETEELARGNALKFLQTIPMTEHNAPIVTKMALEILAARPGKKHWTDQIFGTGRGSRTFVDDIWGKLRTIMPQGGYETPDDLVKDLPAAAKETPRIAAPDEQTVRYGKRLQDSNPPFTPIPPIYDQTTRGGMRGTPPLTGGAPMATRPRRAELFPGMFNYPAQRERTVGAGSTAGEGAPQSVNDVLAARPRPGGPDPNRLYFGDLPGKYTLDSTLYYDEEGNAVRQVVDTRTGQITSKPVGRYTTEKQMIADMQRKQQDMVVRLREEYDLASKVAGQAGYSLSDFMRLPKDMQQKFYDQYGTITLGQAMDKRTLSGVNAERGRAQTGLFRKQTEVLDKTAQSGGLTPGQQQTDYRANLMKAREFKSAFDMANAEAAAAKQALDAHRKPTPGTLGEMTRKLETPEWKAKDIELERKYNEAAGKARAKAMEGEGMFRGFLKARPGASAGETTLDFIPQGGGAYPANMIQPSNPMGMSFEDPNGINPATGLPYSATGDVPLQPDLQGGAPTMVGGAKPQAGPPSVKMPLGAKKPGVDLKAGGATAAAINNTPRGPFFKSANPKSYPVGQQRPYKNRVIEVTGHGPQEVYYKFVK